jgi:hypothetical protein
MKIIYENDTERRNVPIYVTDRSHITDISTDTQILTWRRTWCNLSSIFLILHDFDYSPLFSLSRSAICRNPRVGRAKLRVGCKRWLGVYNHLRTESR